MKSLAHFVLMIGAAAFSAGCSGSQLPIGSPDAALQPMRTQPLGSGSGTVFSITTSGKESVIYSFHGSGDGATPMAGLINLKGTLYGTTMNGGANGEGTVFAITKNGTETVLHSFGGVGDGANPEARLISVNGLLYGTTSKGGAYGNGSVFSVTTSGTETVVHSFKGFPGDGQHPVAPLININGKLYGTTQWGGRGPCAGGTSGGSIAGCGTIFEITSSGKETILYSFGVRNKNFPYPLPLEAPVAGFIHVDGMLYGTALEGGHYLGGGVFECTLAGKETDLFSFNRSTGDEPRGQLLSISGTFFGTTSRGGAYKQGTVFALSSSGSETALHSFGAGSDGGKPLAGLIDVNGTFYGTTHNGGTKRRGTVFAITASGVESVIHDFGSSGDGAGPYSDLINVGGTLYGTTSAGGAR